LGQFTNSLSLAFANKKLISRLDETGERYAEIPITAWTTYAMVVKFYPRTLDSPLTFAYLISESWLFCASCLFDYSAL